MELTGRCLCNNIQFACTTEQGKIYQCHCSRCRKASGSSANANLIINLANFHWLKEPSSLNVYQTSSGWVSSFCQNCGAKAPIIDTDRQRVFVPAGCLDQEKDLTVYKHIFVGSKAQWDCIGGGAPQHDEY